MKLYKLYVRPHLEFAVAAWSPWTVADIECLEKVQKRQSTWSPASKETHTSLS